MTFSMRRVTAAGLMSLSALLAAGCSTGLAAGSSAPPAALASALSVGGQPPENGTPCPAGDYSVTAIEAKDTTQVLGKEVAFRGPVTGLILTIDPDGTWTMVGKKASVAVTLAGVATLNAKIDGKAEGTYTTTGSGYQFVMDDSTGTATVALPGMAGQRRPLSEVAGFIAPTGRTTLGCVGTTATMQSDSATLRLVGVNAGVGSSVAGISIPTATAEPGTVPATEIEGPLTVSTSNRTASYRCGTASGPVTVTGNGSTLSFTGDCPTITIKGSQNKLDITRVSALDVSGDNNTVGWTSAPNGGPEVNDTGTANTITNG